ncbi:hypothetical protein, partial [Hydrogenophaga sp.]|uniref:hypothetical protein n=1 Tax=Hydrogenophaga sp. TaxID=1904254 RepID=UPI0035682812
MSAFVFMIQDACPCEWAVEDHADAIGAAERSAGIDIDLRMVCIEDLDVTVDLESHQVFAQY